MINDTILKLLRLQYKYFWIKIKIQVFLKEFGEKNLLSVSMLFISLEKIQNISNCTTQNFFYFSI